MCYSVPCQVKRLIGDDRGVVDIGGVEQEVVTKLVPDIAVGEYVLIHAGYAIERIDEAMAKETLDIMRSIEPNGAS
ncbi:MAG: HypC/HybG/HupF family hydrogenase formation chaperone [Spirochaetota bacterium]